MVKFNNDLYAVRTNILLADLKETDLIIIPALGSHLKITVKKNKYFIPRTIKQYNKVQNKFVALVLFTNTTLALFAH